MRKVDHELYLLPVSSKAILQRANPSQVLHSLNDVLLETDSGKSIAWVNISHVNPIDHFSSETTCFSPNLGRRPMIWKAQAPKKGSFWDGPMLANRHSRCILAAIDFILECFDIQKSLSSWESS